MTLLLALILFAAAIGLVVAEIFLPTHGVLGVPAFAFAAAGVYACFYASPLLGALSAVVLVASIGVPVGTSRRADARFIIPAKPACTYTSSGSAFGAKRAIALR